MTLHNLADTILPFERFPEAEALLRQALVIKERAYGPQHPAVAETLVVLGALYAARNEYALAESTLDRALAIWAVAPPTDPMPEAEALANLALVRQTQGRFGEAVPLYAKAITRFETGGGSRHPNALRARYNEAASYAAMRNYTVAIQRYEDMLTAAQAAHGPDDPRLARPLIGLATVHLEMGQYGQAEPLYQRAIGLLEKTQPVETRGLAFAIGGLADCYASQKQYAAAEPLYRRGIALLAEPGEGESARARRDDGKSRIDPLVPGPTRRRAALLQPLDRDAQQGLRTGARGAGAPLPRAGPDVPGAEPALAGAGGLRKGARDPRAAAARRMPMALGETLHHLGQVYAAQNQRAEAKRTLERAVKILEAQLGTLGRAGRKRPPRLRKGHRRHALAAGRRPGAPLHEFELDSSPISG